MYNCYNVETADEITKYFEFLSTSASKECKLLLSYIYLKQGKIGQAKAVNNSIVEEEKNTELGIKAKLDNFYIALYNENDPITASSLLKEILSNSKLSTQMELDLAQAILKTYVDTKPGNTQYFNLEQKEEGALALENVQDGLLVNYPNPFNPSTVIRYHIPKIGNLTLKVYDMLGREVVVLANGIKEAGYYTAKFDASHLASGIYFIRLTLALSDGERPFIQSKKILLTK